MKHFNGFEARKDTSSAQLPIDAYVCKIISAEVNSTQYGDKLLVQFDIAEGPYTEYYAHQLADSTFADAKWKGNIRISVPTEGDQYFAQQLRGFNNFMYAVEESNPGFHWDWDEGKLAGKLLGIVYRNKEWEKDGKTGWYSEPFKPVTVEDVHSGNFSIPKEKPLAASKKPAQAETYTTVSEDDCPF